jgi:hypothetical protein
MNLIRILVCERARGETHVAEGNTSATAFVDWLGFTVVLPVGQRRAWLGDAVANVFGVPRCGWSDSGKGWYGYKRRINLGPFGLLAFGGAAQRGTFHVELNGHACRAIRDWNAARLWGETYAANITRVDLAHDDLKGDTVTVARALGWLADGLGFVFTYRGEPIPWANNTAWKAALKRAGIEDFRWHDLRHAWATFHMQAGTPLHVVQELGGWASPKMVQRYAHLTPGHLAAHVAAFGDRVKLSIYDSATEKEGVSA